MTHETPQQLKSSPASSQSTAKEAKEREYWLDHRKNIDKVFFGLCALCALSVAGDFLIHRHVILDIESVFAFYGIFGFIGCVGLVLAAKELRKLLKREEDYYGNDR